MNTSPPPLDKLVADLSDVTTRQMAIRQLARFYGSYRPASPHEVTLLQYLTWGMQDQQTAVRLETVRALHRLGDVDAMRVLAKHLDPPKSDYSPGPYCPVNQG